MIHPHRMMAVSKMVKKKMCPAQQKTCYPTKTAAIRAALSYSRKRGTPLRIYYHAACGSHHVTKTRRWSVDTNNGAVA